MPPSTDRCRWQNGRLQLTWSIGKDALEFDWVEQGGPPAAPPSSLGFGLSIVRSSIEAQFRGGVRYDWRPQGLHCHLSIPRAQIVTPEPVPPANARLPLVRENDGACTALPASSC